MKSTRERRMPTMTSSGEVNSFVSRARQACLMGRCLKKTLNDERRRFLVSSSMPS